MRCSGGLCDAGLCALEGEGGLLVAGVGVAGPAAAGGWHCVVVYVRMNGWMWSGRKVESTVNDDTSSYGCEKIRRCSL